MKQKKLLDNHLSEVLLLLIEGKSLRFIARLFKVHPETLRERLMRLHGAETYIALVSKSGALAVYRESLLKIRNPQRKAEATRWMFCNLDLLLSDSSKTLLTDRQEESLGYRETFGALPFEKMNINGRAHGKLAA